MHVISSPVLRGMKSIDQVKLFLTLREALIDSSLVVVIEYSSILLVFLLVWFRCFPSFANTFMHYSSLRSGSFTHLTTKQFVHQESWNEVHLFFVWVCVPVRMPCVQLHKYVFCFLGATNKALKEIQSTYLNNCSPTRACTQTYKSIHNTFWQSYTKQHAHPSSPCLSSPAPLQGADVWGQLTASANFCVQSKQQHSALLAAKGNLLLKKEKGVGGVFHDDGGESGKRGRRGAGRGETVSRLQVCCVGKFPVSSDTWCCGVGQHQCKQYLPVVSCSISTINQGGPATYLICVETLWPPPCRSVYSPVWAALSKVAHRHKVKQGKNVKTMKWAITQVADPASDISCKLGPAMLIMPLI